MKRSALVFLISSLLAVSQSGAAQTDSSCHLRISILTCSPGEELYSLFGHTALRVTDSATRLDVIYNWGTFDFEEPNFYMKFTRGSLLFYVSPDRIEDFLYEYQYYGRSVTEQVLNLSCEEKLQIKKAIDENMSGNNRFYKYNFQFDNCTTRVRDLIEKNINGMHVTTNIIPEGTTFRNMLYYYLDNGGQPWSKLGIDILLGAKIDKVPTNDQAMFLPEFLMKAVDSSVANNTPLVKEKKLLLPAAPKEDISSVYEPLITIGTICLVIFFISILKSAWARTFTKFADSFLLCITGLLGILILFMWFFTDHLACADNYNLIWTLPTNVVAGFFVWKRPLWVRRYFSLAAIVTGLLLVIWFWLPQQLNIALVPFVLLMFFRYIKLTNAHK